jgi:nucleotide-binding universal stress UspA family protein
VRTDPEQDATLAIRAADLHVVTSPLPALGTVLCAVDTSSAAKAVLYTAAGLAAHPGSRLVVLRVEDRLKSEHDKKAAQVALDEFARETIPGWIGYRQETELITTSGDPAKTILAIAEERGANLVVMGTHSRHGLARMLFGSVTASVLKMTKVPVAVVPPSGPELISLMDRAAVPHLGSVLVPVELHGGSARQLAFASILSIASDREITLLHAIPPKADSAEPLQKLREMAGLLDSHSGVVAVVTHGPVVHVILDRQKRCGAGVVVLGRDAASPGHIAFELLEKTRAVVVFVP